MTRLAILGGGFMGGALAEGLVEAGWSRSELIVAEKIEDRRAELEARLRIETSDDAVKAATAADSVLFAVKPQDIESVLESVRSAFDPPKLAISICAGVRTSAFERILGDTPVVRAMPNTPAAIRQSATAIAPGRFAGDGDVRIATEVLRAVGRVVVVDEEQIDAVTAVSGSGPAYVFYLAEAWIRAAQTEGLSADQARELVYQTLAGSVALLQHDSAPPSELRVRVTSPGGTTQAAIEHLEQSGWANLLEQAIACAKKRSLELGS
jgi:pyrroline-5-carboxylate reductase